MLDSRTLNFSVIICMSQFVFNKEIHYVGKPCKHGHQGYRYKNGGACCECNTDRKEYMASYNKLRLTQPKHIATSLFLACRNRQRKLNPNKPFTITKKWILNKIEKGYCEVTGIKFNLELTKTTKRPFAPSIDKKNPNGFYTKENCQVVCFIYNVAKGEFTHDDVLKLSNAFCKKCL